MNILQKMARKIIESSFNFSVYIIQRFYLMDTYANKIENLRQYPIGTLGNDIAKCLDENKLTLVPNFESHDLKHVLLDYKMTPVDEVRMQSFMLGNGNYTIPCFAILIFGTILLPEEWNTFYKDFKRGRQSKPISSWTIEDFANLETLNLRKRIFTVNHKTKPIFNMEKLTKYAAVISIVAGIFGMIFCLPFLFSQNLADLVGAGFPFIGGAILTTGGLLALSNLAIRNTRKAEF